MSKKTKFNNPYNPGSEYHSIAADLASCPKTLESLCKRHPEASVRVIISPRAIGEGRGDPRGNASAKGHLHYSPRTTGKDGVTRFGIANRETALEPKKRNTTPKITSGKTSTKTKTKTSKTKKIQKTEATEATVKA